MGPAFIEYFQVHTVRSSYFERHYTLTGNANLDTMSLSNNSEIYIAIHDIVTVMTDGSHTEHQHSENSDK